MLKVTIHCGGCGKNFEFRHPSISRVSQLMGVTLTCPHCHKDLHTPDDQLLMIPMQELMMSRLVRDGYNISPDAPMGVIEL